MKVRDVIKKIEANGWYMVRQEGSHRVFQHDKKSGIVVIAGHPRDEVDKGTLNSIWKQAGLK